MNEEALKAENEQLQLRLKTALAQLSDALKGRDSAIQSTQSNFDNLVQQNKNTEAGLHSDIKLLKQMLKDAKDEIQILKSQKPVDQIPQEAMKESLVEILEEEKAKYEKER